MQTTTKKTIRDYTMSSCPTFFLGSTFQPPTHTLDRPAVNHDFSGLLQAVGERSGFSVFWESETLRVFCLPPYLLKRIVSRRRCVGTNYSCSYYMWVWVPSQTGQKDGSWRSCSCPCWLERDLSHGLGTAATGPISPQATLLFAALQCCHHPACPWETGCWTGGRISRSSWKSQR